VIEEAIFMKISSTESLLSALDNRGTTPEERARFDEEVWKQCGTNGAILVTDLTGFTKSTKSHGILQFLSIFRRFQTAFLPVLAKHGGELLKQEADDLFGVFTDASQALNAGVNLLQAVAELNSNLHPDDHMGLSVGVDYGRYLRLSDDAYGDPVNVAFKLGEDIAGPGEVRVGSSAYEQAQTESWTPAGIRIEGPLSGDKSGVSLQHYILRLS